MIIIVMIMMGEEGGGGLEVNYPEVVQEKVWWWRWYW